jgi:hypothetical protein
MDVNLFSFSFLIGIISSGYFLFLIRFDFNLFLFSGYRQVLRPPSLTFSSHNNIFYVPNLPAWKAISQGLCIIDQRVVFVLLSAEL